jgi:hypothetical protein
VRSIPLPGPPPPGGQQLGLGAQCRRLAARIYRGRASVGQGDQQLVDAPICDLELVAQRLDGAWRILSETISLSSSRSRTFFPTQLQEDFLLHGPRTNAA